MRVKSVSRFAGTATVAAALVISLGACGGNGNSSSHTSSSSGSSASQSGGNTGTVAGGVTKKQAGKIVTDKYGGQVVGIESDQEKGQATWEVEVKHSRKGRIEVDVAKSSGSVVAFEKD